MAAVRQDPSVAGYVALCRLCFSGCNVSATFQQQGEAMAAEAVRLFADEPALPAYQSAFKAAKSRQIGLPIDQYLNIRAALDELDKHATAHPHHAEVRYVRAATTLNLPALVARPDQTATDIRWLYQYVLDTEPTDADLFRAIIQFLLGSNQLARSQRQRLNILLENLPLE